jgi:hypothetical protein
MEVKKLDGTKVSIFFIMSAFGVLGEGNFVLTASKYVMESNQNIVK